MLWNVLIVALVKRDEIEALDKQTLCISLHSDVLLIITLLMLTT